VGVHLGAVLLKYGIDEEVQGASSQNATECGEDVVQSWNNENTCNTGTTSKHLQKFDKQMPCGSCAKKLHDWTDNCALTDDIAHTIKIYFLKHFCTCN